MPPERRLAKLWGPRQPGLFSLDFGAEPLEWVERQAEDNLTMKGERRESERGNPQLTVSEAGRQGGLALLRKRGAGHFAEIGKSGQAAMRQAHPGMASIWGKMGGRPNKPTQNGLGKE